MLRGRRWSKREQNASRHSESSVALGQRPASGAAASQRARGKAGRKGDVPSYWLQYLPVTEKRFGVVRYFRPAHQRPNPGTPVISPRGWARQRSCPGLGVAVVAGGVLACRLSRRRGCGGLRQLNTGLERSVIPRRRAQTDGPAGPGGRTLLSQLITAGPWALGQDPSRAWEGS